MKTIAALLFVVISLVSCTRVYQAGDLNMISNRNVDSKTEYELLKRYVGESKKEIKRNRSNTIEMAIDKVVRSTPGGEFLKNAKVYLVVKNGGKKIYYAVEGDVWGMQPK